MPSRRQILLGLCGLALASEAGTAMAASGELEIVFDEVQRRLIRDYFADQRHRERHQHGQDDNGKGGKGKKTPPGLAKRDQLPPGLQKQLQRNGTLPPGLQARGLPGDLESRLRPLPHGVERVIAGNDVLLVRKATGVILDIIENALGQ